MATLDLNRNKSLSEHGQFQQNNSNNSFHKICLKHGILTALLLIASFYTFYVLTYQFEINQLIVPDLFLLLIGVYFALQNYSPTGKSGSIDYFEGFKVGIYSSTMAVFVYALFIGVYSLFDTTISERLKEGLLHDIYSNPFIVSFAFMFEGLAAGIIITFCLMQYFKKPET